MKQIKNAPINNVVNEGKWDRSQHLKYFQERLEAMRSKKSEFETKFKENEKQESSGSFYDNLWNLVVVPPLEQNLTEIYMGRTNGKVNYNIVPDSEADIEELMPTKYVLQYYLDWNQKDDFWKENKDFRHNKSTYGTGLFFTGMRSYKDIRHKMKEDAVIQSGTDVLNEDNFEEYVNETWFFFPKSIHPMDYYHDDAAYWCPDLQYAEDCIYKEKVSFKEFELMFWDNDAIDKDCYQSITTWIDIQEKNDNSQSIHQEEIILYYYYNRVTKAFYIVANEDKMLYQGIYRYDDGKLPFVSAQHYPNNNCFWGRGIPDRIGYLKAYKGDILNDILQGAAMANSVNFLTEWDDTISQDWDIWGRGVNVWRTTWGAERVQRMDTTINLGYFQALLQIIDDLVVQDTWDNPRAPFQAQTDKVGIAEIIEINKQQRQSSVDEGYNLALDQALTMMLDRIKMFAPALMSEKVLWEDGKTLKVTYPSIRFENAEIKKENGKTYVREKKGKYGYFDLKPKSIGGAWVKVQTSSSNSIMPILERQKVTEYINNITALANIAQFVPELWKKLNEHVDTQWLLDWMDKSYWYDTKLSAQTDRDKIQAEAKKKKQEMLKQSKDILNNMQNVQNTPEALPQTQAPNPQNQGLWQALWWM